MKLLKKYWWIVALVIIITGAIIFFVFKPKKKNTVNDIIIFRNLVKENNEAFINKLVEVCNYLEVNASWIMAVMWKESRLNHRAVNSDTGATGLIQFMPSTAKGLGTTTTALRNMSNVQQLEYVKKYFAPYKGKIHSFFDAYLVVFFPVAIGKPDNWEFKTSSISASSIGKDNPGINGGLPITKISFRKYLLKGIDVSLHQYLS